MGNGWEWEVLCAGSVLWKAFLCILRNCNQHRNKEVARKLQESCGFYGRVDNFD